MPARNGWFSESDFREDHVKPESFLSHRTRGVLEQVSIHVNQFLTKNSYSPEVVANTLYVLKNVLMPKIIRAIEAKFAGDFLGLEALIIAFGENKPKYPEQSEIVSILEDVEARLDFLDDYSRGQILNEIRRVLFVMFAYEEPR